MTRPYAIRCRRREHTPVQTDTSLAQRARHERRQHAARSLLPQERQSTAHHAIVRPSQPSDIHLDFLFSAHAELLNMFSTLHWHHVRRAAHACERGRACDDSELRVRRAGRRRDSSPPLSARAAHPKIYPYWTRGVQPGGTIPSK
jgi:hypothetical protein